MIILAKFLSGTAVLQTLGRCENPATQDTAICKLIGEALTNDTDEIPAAFAADSDQLFIIYNPLTSVFQLAELPHPVLHGLCELPLP